MTSLGSSIANRRRRKIDILICVLKYKRQTSFNLNLYEALFGVKLYKEVISLANHSFN